MSSVVLTVVDTAGIQDYVFASNRLRENIGASLLVERTTRDWVYDSLQSLAMKHNVGRARHGRLEFNDMQLVRDELTAEVIYAGGGNTVILFQARDDDPLDEAKRFARELSRKSLLDAPGLELVIAHSEPFQWEDDDLKERVGGLIDGKLTAKKRTRQATIVPLLGLGVTAECSSTGLVATHTSRKREPRQARQRLVSRESAVKLDSVPAANNRLQEMILRNDQDGKFAELVFTNELDHLSRTGGEESYIAVVHADGNGMGKRIADIASSTQNNLDYISRMRSFSQAIEDAAERALINTLRTLRRSIAPDEKGMWVLTEVVQQVAGPGHQINKPQKRIVLYQPKKEDDDERGEDAGKPRWPFRPLVFGGDDVTFICNGQIGLSLAALYVREFQAQTRDILDGKGSVHSCAGVCVVKVHYPFRRAYDLSEQLTKSVKRSLGDKRAHVSALDWHFSATGLSGGLSEIRRREYELLDNRSLLMRPVRMAEQKDWRTWENFQRLTAVLNYDGRWAGRRNKLKALREALRAGKQSVREFLALYLRTADQKDPALPKLTGASDTLAKEGFVSSLYGRRTVDYCGYFDALEAMDHHLFLEELTDD
jgi:Cas10/Cmr2, second palm domain